MRSRTTLGVLAALMVLSAPAARATAPVQPDPGAWVPDYSVAQVVHHGATTYVAGYFTWWGPWNGAGAELSVPAGSINPKFPIVAGGQILAATADGGGGVYIGGSFTSVGGQPVARLAHLLANGSVDTGFEPDPTDEVTALALAPCTGLYCTSTLYVAGKFGSIGGVQRDGLAALDLSVFGTAVSDSFAPCTDYAQTDYTFDQPFPFALAVSGTTVYVGGDFDYASGGPADPTTHKPTCTGQQNASHLFAVDRSTGVVSSTFLPQPGGEVDALALSPDGNTLYVGGQFDYVPGNPGFSGLAAVSAGTGALDAGWNPRPDGQVYALLTSGSTVYAGGAFTQIGANSAHRAGVAQLDGVNAQAADATPFNPGLHALPERAATVRALAFDSPASPTRVAIGGYFQSAPGRDNLVLADPGTGLVTGGFAPQPGGQVNAVAFAGGSTLYEGGTLDSTGATYHPGLVALDGWGHAKPVTFAGASFENQIALSPDGSTLYAVSNYGSTTAAWSTTTGAKLPWIAPCCVVAVAAAPNGKAVYLGGGFTTVGGFPRVHLAAVSPTTGAPTAWRPDPDGPVEAIAVSPDGGTVYAGGVFKHIGTSVSARSNLAALSAATGDVTPWSPNPDGQVEALTVTGDGAHVFAGGEFGSIGQQPQPRAHLAELTASTGNPTPFAQTDAPDGAVTSIAPTSNDSVVYVGGRFKHVGFDPFWAVAALDGGSGAPLTWNPASTPLGSTPFGSVAADGDTLWASADETQLGSDLRPYYAQFSTAPVSAGPPHIAPAPRAGTTVACVSGGWSNAPAQLSVSWSADGKPIPGANARTLTLRATQAGHKLTCTEAAANPGGSASATSAVATIAPAPAPVLAVHVAHTRFHRGTGTFLRIQLTVPATVTLKLVLQLPDHRTRPAGSVIWRLPAGTTRVLLKLVKGHKLAPGRYLAAFTASAGASRSRTAKVVLTVVR